MQSLDTRDTDALKRLLIQSLTDILGGDWSALSTVDPLHSPPSPAVANSLEQLGHAVRDRLVIISPGAPQQWARPITRFIERQPPSAGELLQLTDAIGPRAAGGMWAGLLSIDAHRSGWPRRHAPSAAHWHAYRALHRAHRDRIRRWLSVAE